MTFYIQTKYMKTTETFHPVDESGNEIDWISCNFDSQGTCEIKISPSGHYNSRTQTATPFTPKVLFNKGDKKAEVNQRLIDSLQEAVIKLSDKFSALIKDIESKQKSLKASISTPFVPDDIQNIALESVEKQREDMKLRHKDCERLMSLVE